MERNDVIRRGPWAAFGVDWSLNATESLGFSSPVSWFVHVCHWVIIWEIWTKFDSVVLSKKLLWVKNESQKWMCPNVLLKNAAWIQVPWLTLRLLMELLLWRWARQSWLGVWFWARGLILINHASKLHVKVKRLKNNVSLESFVEFCMSVNGWTSFQWRFCLITILTFYGLKYNLVCTKLSLQDVYC